MENLLKELDTLSKKKSKISGGGKKRAAEILTEVYNSNGNMKWLCQELIALPIGVQAEFFASNYVKFEKGDKLKLLVDTLVSDPTFIKNARSEPVKRTVEIIDIYLKKGNFDASVCVLFNATLKVAFKKYQVNDSFVTLFNTKIIENSGYEFLRLNFVNDETIFVFLLLDSLGVDESRLKDWALYEQYAKGEHRTVVEAKLKKPKKTKESTSTVALQGSIDDLQAMAEKITKSLHEEYGTIASLKQKIQEQNTIIESLTNNSNVTAIPSYKPSGNGENNDAELDELLARVIELEDELKAEKLKSTDLDERLTLAFNMDKSTISQEIITLKNDIEQSLKLEYNNFQENINVACNEDMFIAYRATITRIFRTLKRFGVEFE